MLKKMKKKYLQKIIFLWLFCAVLFSVPLLIISIRNGKWIIGILVAMVSFSVAAVPIYLSMLCISKFERVVREQEKIHSLRFSDEEAELLSNYGYVYLSKNWLVKYPNWIFHRSYITEITYEFFNYEKGEKCCCFIHTANNENHTAWVANQKSAEKIEKWLSESN